MSITGIFVSFRFRDFLTGDLLLGLSFNEASATEEGIVFPFPSGLFVKGMTNSLFVISSRTLRSSSTGLLVASGTVERERDGWGVSTRSTISTWSNEPALSRAAIAHKFRNPVGSVELERFDVLD